MIELPPNPGADPTADSPVGIARLVQSASTHAFGQPTNCYVVESGEGALVVDPPSRGPELLDEIERAADPAGGIHAIVITHGHVDHVGGVAALVRRTGVPVRAHRALLATLPDRVDVEPIAEGDQLAGWRVIESPGHSVDSISLFEPERRIAIVGDLVAGSGTVAIEPTHGDMGAYLRSLTRLAEEFAPEIVLAGHGPVITDPQMLLGHFISHRLSRERRVLAALNDTARPIEALLPSVYPDLNALLVPPALATLVAHLRKLAEDGRAIEEDDGWRLAST